MGYAVGDHNIYNRPGGLSWQIPGWFSSIESMTPMIYNVPYDVTLRRYILNSQLPLWNNNRGMGTPFAAQGGESLFPTYDYKVSSSLCILELCDIFRFLFGEYFLIFIP